MSYEGSRARPYTKSGKRGRWEVDLRGTLDNGLEIDRVRRIYPSSPSAGPIGKRQAEAMAREEFARWNRHGQVLRPGSVPPMRHTGGMKKGVAPTFKQFVADFLEFCASPNASSKGANAPASLRAKEQSLRLHLLPCFGSMPMDALKARDVDLFVINKSNAGRSRNAISNDVSTLRRMLVVAQNHGLIPEVPNFRTPAREHGKVKGLDPDEAKLFRDALHVRYERRRATLVELYLRAGLRLGEGLALTPADFSLDVERPVVRVHRTYTAGEFGPTKGRRPRVVPLPLDLAAEVDALLRERGLSPRSKTQHPFSAVKGNMGRPLHSGYAGVIVSSTAKAAKIRPIHPHVLRHTFGTECARRGVPVLTLKEWMGHKRINTTMVYVHLAAPDHLRWGHLLDE